MCQALSPGHMLPHAHKFKDKINKNFKMAITEHYIPNTVLFRVWGPMQPHWSLTYQ